MDHKTVEEYVLSMPGAKLEYPFGEEVAVYKVFVPAPSSVSHFDTLQGGSEKRTEPYSGTVKGVSELANAAMYKNQLQVSGSATEQAAELRGDWKMFALIAEGKDPVRISLKCDPLLSKILREKYTEIMEGYHLNKKHWNTIILAGQLPWEEIQGLIRHSYILVSEGSDAHAPTS